MNKIVRENYPASKLPSDLREGIDPESTVTVTVEGKVRAPAVLNFDELKELLKRAGAKATGVSAEEAVARIRALRDEWDE